MNIFPRWKGGPSSKKLIKKRMIRVRREGGQKENPEPACRGRPEIRQRMKRGRGDTHANRPLKD